MSSNVPAVKKVRKEKKVKAPKVPIEAVEPVVEEPVAVTPVEIEEPAEPEVQEIVEPETEKVVKKRKLLSVDEKKERQQKRKDEKTLQNQALREEHLAKLQEIKDQEKILKQSIRKLKPKKASSGGLSKTKVVAKALVDYLEKYLTEPEEAELLEKHYDNGQLVITRPMLTSLLSKVFKKKNLCKGMDIIADEELNALFKTDKLSYYTIQKNYAPFLSDA